MAGPLAYLAQPGTPETPARSDCPQDNWNQASNLPIVFPAAVAGKILCKKCLILLGQTSRVALCPLYPRKRTCAVQLAMSALGQERTSAFSCFDPLSAKDANLCH